jgi:hypothetical protein
MTAWWFNEICSVVTTLVRIPNDNTADDENSKSTVSFTVERVIIRFCSEG